MSKILVVGGAGYIGGYLCDLLAKEHNVMVYDSLVYEDKYLKPIDFVYGDIRDHNRLSTILSLEKPDVVIWLAALVGDGACAINPSLSKEINEDSVKWIVDNYKGKLVFTSTCSVYGAQEGMLSEDSPTNPLSIYASTKLEAERYVRERCKDYLIFRLGTLFGLSDTYSRVRFDLVVNILAKRAACKETLKVFGGSQWRPLIHVKDVSNAISFGLKKDIRGLYNLSCGNYTILDLAEEIQKLLPDTKIQTEECKFEDLRNYKVTSLFDQYDWRPSFSLAEGILEIYTVVVNGRIRNVENPLYYNDRYLKGTI